LYLLGYDKFEDTKGTMRNCNSKKRQFNRPKGKGQKDKLTHKALHRKLNILQHETQQLRKTHDHTHVCKLVHIMFVL